MEVVNRSVEEVVDLVVVVVVWELVEKTKGAEDVLVTRRGIRIFGIFATE